MNKLRRKTGRNLPIKNIEEWRRHFMGLLQGEEMNREEGVEVISLDNKTELPEELLTSTEDWHKEIVGLKRGRAPGKDGITKYGYSRKVQKCVED